MMHLILRVQGRVNLHTFLWTLGSSFNEVTWLLSSSHSLRSTSLRSGDSPLLLVTDAFTSVMVLLDGWWGERCAAAAIDLSVRPRNLSHATSCLYETCLSSSEGCLLMYRKFEWFSNSIDFHVLPDVDNFYHRNKKVRVLPYNHPHIYPTTSGSWSISILYRLSKKTNNNNHIFSTNNFQNCDLIWI